MIIRTALITGAAVRVGQAIALSLADNGWDIAFHYNRSEKPAEKLAKLIRSKRRKATLVQADLADSASVARLIPTLSKQGIKLDCLINNAAAFGKNDLANLNSQNWYAHMDVNLFAPLLLMRDFAAQYKGTSGNIINITDGMLGWSISPKYLSYSLSKLGLGNATELLARELAPRIRINAIAPGPTLEGAQDKKDTFAKLAKIIPLKRTSSPKEICDAVHFLLSASSVTGQQIALSGGLQTHPVFAA
jgi:NAD(P)-dependent dehydrogenase (short-subunit alcohol dehydrogenase family)